MTATEDMGKGSGERLTGVNVSDDDLGSLVCEETSGFSTNALSGAGDDGGLAGEHTLWVVQVAYDLSCAFRHCEVCV